MPDLYLEPRPGSPNWYIRGTDPDGGPVFRSTKTSDRATAEALLVQLNARYLEERVHGKTVTTKFSEGARAYLADGGERRYLFRELADGRDVGLIPYFGERVMHTITQVDLDRAAVELCEPGASRETLIRNVYTPFIAVWTFCASEARKLVEPRQWARPRAKKGTGVTRGAPSRSGSRPVSYDRAWKFVSAMSPAPAMVMTQLFYSGMRPIEVFALRPDDVNIEGRWIVVLDSKTGEPRGVPMHEVLVPMLTALKARGADRLFLTRHEKPYPITDTEEGVGGQLKGAVKGARQRLSETGAAINDVSPYTARHTVSTQLVVNRVHPHIKDQILGHAADDMSRRYTEVPQEPLIEAINTLPVISAWRDAEWLNDPLVWQTKLLPWSKTPKLGSGLPKAESVHTQKLLF